MEKQYTKDKNEKLAAKKEDIKNIPKHEIKETGKEAEVKKEIEEKIEEKKEEKQEKAEEKKEEKKKEIVKKDKAVIYGNNLGISKKHSMAICDYIRGREIEKMIDDLGKVVKIKRAIPMKGEIPHRHGNIMSGRYPVNASKVFINLLKTLNANVSVNGIENAVIKVAIANDASRPFKRGGSMRFKRTNVYLEARENKQKAMEKK